MQPKNKGSLKAFAPQAEPQPQPIHEESPEKPAKRQKKFMVTPEQERQIKAYCYHAEVTMQEMIVEGLNMVLRSKGMPELKE